MDTSIIIVLSVFTLIWLSDKLRNYLKQYSSHVDKIFDDTFGLIFIVIGVAISIGVVFIIGLMIKLFIIDHFF
jgi:threonine/homoserine/homoserine lactone efflux protein